MFTGIVEELGEVIGRHPSRDGLVFAIRGKLVLGDLKVGDSISVNGVCLTATDVSPSFFQADVMPETLRRSNLKAVKAGDKVNLERALTPTSRLGGHFVSGHIDGLGVVADKETEGNALLFRFRSPAGLMPYIVEKGSVAVDGISLTVTETGDDYFCVSLVPHTVKLTTLGFKKRGDEVNLEVDMLAKFIEKQLRAFFVNDNAPASRERLFESERADKEARLNQLLRENGYL